MKKIAELAGFLVGCAILVAGFGVGWADWGKLANQVIVMQTVMGALVGVVAFVIATAVISKARDRWRALILASVLLLGFSVLLFDIGLLFAPIPLVVLLYSVSRLRKEPKRAEVA